MTKIQASRAASVLAAALMTLVMFSGTGALAGQQAAHVAAAQVDRDVPMLTAQAQRVEIVGHRVPA